MNDMAVPRTGPDTAAVIDHALESLGAVRGVIHADDPGTRLRLLGSLHAEIHSALVGAVGHAREHGYESAEIAQLVGGAVDGYSA